MLTRRIVLGLSIAALLAACTGAGSSSEQSSNPKAGGVLHVGMTGATYGGFDPQNEWLFSTWELYRCCLLRTLMSYNGSSGPTGTTPQPDLATSPPIVSSDGMTWTFHIRSGLHYGPPLQNVEITAPDIVRALLRAGDPHTANVYLSDLYLSDIEGFSAYQHGRSDSISGLETPDPHTLVIHEIHPDSSLTYDMALATTAPIPPSTPATKLGVATGHDRSSDPMDVGGYGRVLVSSGPYMIQGEGSVDFSKPPDRQTPATGFVPWKFQPRGSPTPGSITLVRNPSWDPSTDPLREALPNEIVVTGGSVPSLFRKFEAGQLPLVFDSVPDAALLQKYLSDPSLHGYAQTLNTDNVFIADFDMAQPPFDDVHVRRAVAYAMDRAAMLTPMLHAWNFFSSFVVADHYASDSTEGSLASGWDPFPNSTGAPDMAAARHALQGSPYAKGGRCADPVCNNVLVVVRPGMDPVPEELVKTLASLGIHASVRLPADGQQFYDLCKDLSVHWGICVGDNWLPDVPSTGNGLIAFFGGPSYIKQVNFSRMGAPASVLRQNGFPVTSTPSVDPQIASCLQQEGAASVACWTSLDQYLVTQVMPAVPLAFAQVVRLTSPSIGNFSWDQANQEPALDRLQVIGA